MDEQDTWSRESERQNSIGDEDAETSWYTKRKHPDKTAVTRNKWGAESRARKGAKENATDTMSRSEENLREEVRKCYRSILDAEEANNECERTHDSVRRALYNDTSRDTSLYGSQGKLNSPRSSLNRFSKSETSLTDVTNRPPTADSPRRPYGGHRRLMDDPFDLDRTPPSSMWRPKSYNRYNRYERSNQALRPPTITVTDTSYEERLEPKHRLRDMEIKTAYPFAYSKRSLGLDTSDLSQGGSSVNQQDAEGKIPLHHAAQHGQIATLHNLIRDGAIVNAVDNHGKSPLTYAVENGYTSIVRELIYHGAYVGQKDREGRTPLIIATAEGKKMLVDLLLRSGASVYMTDKYLKAPIHYAAENNYPSIVEELIRYGAPINQSDGDQRKPLHIAAENGYLFVVELLLRRGANVDALDRKMQTSLFLAVRHGLEFIVHTLLRNGASANSSDRIRQTPLHVAAGRGHSTIASDLLHHGARTETRDDKGKSPIFYAVEDKDIKMIDLLIRYGAHVDVADNRGQSLLSYAVETQDDDIVYLVAKHELKSNANRPVLLKQIQTAIVQNSEFLGRIVWNHLLDHCQAVAHDPVEARVCETTVKVLLDLTTKSFQKAMGASVWKTETEFRDGKVTKPAIGAHVETMPANIKLSHMGVPVTYRLLHETSLDDPTDVSLTFDTIEKPSPKEID